NAQCDTANGLGRQYRDLISRLTGQAARKFPDTAGGSFTMGVKHGGDDDAQKEVQDEQAEVAGLADKPSDELGRVRRQQFGKFFWADSGHALPTFDGGTANHRDLFEPGRRWRDFDGGQ